MSAGKPAEEAYKHLRGEVVDKVAALATASFGLVAALAWNSAIQTAFEPYPATDDARVLGRVLYALLVTVIAAVATVWIGRVAGRVRAGLERLPHAPVRRGSP